MTNNDIDNFAQVVSCIDHPFVKSFDNLIIDVPHSPYEKYGSRVAILILALMYEKHHASSTLLDRLVRTTPVGSSKILRWLYMACPDYVKTVPRISRYSTFLRGVWTAVLFWFTGGINCSVA